MNIQNAFGKTIVQNCIKMIKAQPKLLFFPAIGSSINFLLLVIIGHPIYQYELARMHDKTAPPVYQLVIFYTVLLLYLYFRNIVNAWLNDATIRSIYLLNEKKQAQPLKSAFKHANQNFLRSFRWISLVSTLGFWLRILQSWLINFKFFRKFVGDENWIMAVTLTPTLLALEKISVRSALKRSSKLIAHIWGHAPLKANFYIGNIYIKYLLIAILPILIALLFNKPVIFNIALTISVIYYLFILCSFKAIAAIINMSLYSYSAHNQVTAPFTEKIIPHAFYHSES